MRTFMSEILYSVLYFAWCSDDDTLRYDRSCLSSGGTCVYEDLRILLCGSSDASDRKKLYF